MTIGPVQLVTLGFTSPDIRPLDLVGIGLATAQEAQQLHEMERPAVTAQP